MGLTFSRVWERMFGKKEMRILMVGLDAAGKTTVREGFLFTYGTENHRNCLGCITDLVQAQAW